jgi:hypothetical protein
MHYPTIVEVKVMPTVYKHGLLLNAKKLITHVVLIHSDWKQLNEACEALFNIFQLTAANPPKDIFFLVSSSMMNGMITHELYHHDLVNAHHKHMTNIRSFAISGISNINAPMQAQDTTDINSSVQSTLKSLILDAKSQELTPKSSLPSKQLGLVARQKEEILAPDKQKQNRTG